MQNLFAYDVLVIGGSYAGLSAALALGWARRSVLVLDAQRPRNRFTPHAHNLLLHDGTAPAELAARASQQVAAYPTVAIRVAEAATATQLSGGAFEVTTTAPEAFRAGRLLLGQDLLRVDEQDQTTVPGVWAAGDCCAPLHQLAAAIAAGNLAGATLSRELIFGA